MTDALTNSATSLPLNGRVNPQTITERIDKCAPYKKHKYKEQLQIWKHCGNKEIDHRKR
jgi:hypothetical protein